jgi:hypothetical protein
VHAARRALAGRGDRCPTRYGDHRSKLLRRFDLRQRSDSKPLQPGRHRRRGTTGTQ